MTTHANIPAGEPVPADCPGPCPASRSGECLEHPSPVVYRHLSAELARARRGPDRTDLVAWMLEILAEAADRTNGGEALDLPGAVSALAEWMQPVGVFNGGGSIFVLSDPTGWKYSELAVTGYRRMLDRAAARDAARDAAGA